MFFAALLRRRTFAACAGLKRGVSTAPLIGFVGLGNMGSNMAANLAAKAGHSLLVFDGVCLYLIPTLQLEHYKACTDITRACGDHQDSVT
jgi:NAD binding domain of 6-phosphogluconate dehydrogenase